MKGNITEKEREIKPKKRQVMHNAIAHHPLTDAQAAIGPSQPTPPSLYTEHDVLWHRISLWLVRVSCPGPAPSQLFVHLLAGRAWETEQSLTSDKCYLATTKTSVCYQHCSHTKSKTHYQLLRRKLTLSQPKQGQGFSSRKHPHTNMKFMYHRTVKQEKNKFSCSKNLELVKTTVMPTNAHTQE